MCAKRQHVAHCAPPNLADIPTPMQRILMEGGVKIGMQEKVVLLVNIIQLAAFFYDSAEILFFRG